jgi:hypothetical protein
VLPTGLPILESGVHETATEGACLLEFVSILAGESFSDHPSCAHPVLAAIARAVGEQISDVRRPGLARFAPDIIGTVTAGWQVDTVLCGLVAAAALHVDMTDYDAQAVLHRSQRRADRSCLGLPGRWKIVTRHRYRRTTVVTVSQLVDAVARGGDDRLEALLTDAVGVCRRHMRTQPARR